jgi:predicted amidohydrolase YtcJ
VIGDAAMDQVIAGFDEAAAQIGDEVIRTAQHRLEHVEMADEAARQVLARLGVIASVQPVFDTWWGGEAGMYAERLGSQRALRLNEFAAMQSAGIPLALGSDAPVTPLGPWQAVRGAVHHQRHDQRLTPRAAFAAHTRGGWRAAGRRGGTLDVGEPATFAVWHCDELVVETPDPRVSAWSTDPRAGVPGLPSLDPESPDPTCLRTVVNGRTVYAERDTDELIEGRSS